MRKYNSEFKTNFISEAGTFAFNKDYFAFLELDDFACWIVGDGIDSDEEIQSAEIAASSIFSDFNEKPTISRRILKKYMINAQHMLEKESKNIRLKASLIVVVTDYSKIVWMVAGNARLYYFSSQRFVFKSKDQSIAQMMFETGKINEYEIDQHSEKNNLTNFLGKPSGFKPFVSNKFKLNNGDIMLLCTSGFWENVSSSDMNQAIKEVKEPDELTDNLEDILLGQQQKTINNYTAAAIYANKVFKEENNKGKLYYIKKTCMVLLPVLIIAAAIAMYIIMNYRNKEKIRTDMATHDSSGNSFVKSGNYDKALQEYNIALKDLDKVEDKKKDKGKRTELNNKINITQDVIDGDKETENKKYDKAEDEYKKARTQSINQKDYDQTELDKKIAQNQQYLSILQYERIGDQQMENGDYSGAKATYLKVKDRASQVSFDDVNQEIDSKIDSADAKIIQLDKQQKQVQSSSLEKKGDDAYFTQEYKEALYYYEMAQELYQQVNNIGAVLAIQTKIKDTQEKLHPVATPAPAPTPMISNVPK